MKDRIFADRMEEVPKFSFDDKVAEVFHDMASRSIPGYAEIIKGIGKMAAVFAQKDTAVYDLGCSLGACTLEMRRHLAPEKVGQMYAVDCSKAMIDRCRFYLSSYKSDIPVNIVLGDVTELSMQTASFTVMNFVMQFMRPEERDAVAKKIFDATCDGGAFVISEKMAFSDPAAHGLMNELYWDFKRDNGYSELEISQKRNALEEVLIPDTRESIENRLKRAGFGTVVSWYQNYNFASFLAIKN